LNKTKTKKEMRVLFGGVFLAKEKKGGNRVYLGETRSSSFFF